VAAYAPSEQYTVDFRKEPCFFAVNLEWMPILGRGCPGLAAACVAINHLACCAPTRVARGRGVSLSWLSFPLRITIWRADQLQGVSGALPEVTMPIHAPSTMESFWRRVPTAVKKLCSGGATGGLALPRRGHLTTSAIPVREICRKLEDENDRPRNRSCGPHDLVTLPWMSTLFAPAIPRVNTKVHLFWIAVQK